MKKPKKSPVGYAALVFAVFVLLCLIALICLSSVEASAKDTSPNFRSICKKIPEPEGEWWNGGHLFLLKRDKNGHAVAQLGWVKWKGHLYYCHKTASEKYPLGSATRGELRDRGSNHWVAFDDKGRRITQDQYVGKGPRRRAKSLELDKNGYVKYNESPSSALNWFSAIYAFIQHCPVISLYPLQPAGTQAAGAGQRQVGLSRTAVLS